jgi:Ca2+/Na+ antiporter
MNALYRFGVGFSFDFDKFKFKKEAFIVTFLILAAGIPLGVMLYIGDLYINMIFLVLSLSIFFYYSVRKENEENASLFIE